MRRFFLLILLFITLSLPAFSLRREEGAQGVDLSRYNRVKDWKALAENIDFAYLKVSEGGNWHDPLFHRNSRQARKNGVLVGGYHYFTTSCNGRMQFENFRKGVGEFNLDLIPVIDIEKNKSGWSEGELVREINDFIQACVETYGVKPMIYTKETFRKEWLRSLPDDILYWCGAIEEEEGEDADMVQYEIAPLPGVESPVDCNTLLIPIENILLPK